MLPKLMLKEFNNQTSEKLKILNIYHYLYKFSLERLQRMLLRKEMALLMVVYISQTKRERIENSSPMRKHKFAYFEA